MTFISRVELPEPHHCVVPEVGNLDVGTVWECGSCGTQWGIRWCAGDYGHYRDWRKMENGRFLGWWRSGRVPRHYADDIA